MSLDDILTVKEAAEKLKIGISVMYQYARQPGFPSFRLGRKIRIKASELEEWVKSQMKNPDKSLIG